MPVDITTPIAYISNVFLDPFKNPGFDFITGRSFGTPQILDRAYYFTNIEEFFEAPGNGFDQNES